MCTYTVESHSNPNEVVTTNEVYNSDPKLEAAEGNTNEIRQNQRSKRTKVITMLKDNLRSLLVQHHGSTEHDSVKEAIQSIADASSHQEEDNTSPANKSSLVTGEFYAETCPNFPGRIEPEPGKEDIVQYTLGRLSFNIFQPNHLLCTVHSVRNQVFPYQSSANSSVPSLITESSECSLYSECSSSAEKEHAATASKKEASSSSEDDHKQTYHVVCDITIHTEKGDLPAILRNEGVCYPYKGKDSSNPEKSNRLMVTFTGGTLMPAEELRNNTEKLALWEETFQGAYEKAEKERSLLSKTFMYMLSTMLGLTLPTDAADNSELFKHTFHFTMKRSPTGYVDILYIDNDMRITKGNKGTLVVCERSSKARTAV